MRYRAASQGHASSSLRRGFSGPHSTARRGFTTLKTLWITNHVYQYEMEVDSWNRVQHSADHLAARTQVNVRQEPFDDS
jgi:hypothetical protein